jgi:hypothetical protein
MSMPEPVAVLTGGVEAAALTAGGRLAVPADLTDEVALLDAMLRVVRAPAVGGSLSDSRTRPDLQVSENKVGHVPDI